MNGFWTSFSRDSAIGFCPIQTGRLFLTICRKIAFTENSVRETYRLNRGKTKNLAITGSNVCWIFFIFRSIEERCGVLHLSRLSIIRTWITRRSVPNFACVIVSSFLLIGCQSVSEFVAEDNLPSSRTSVSAYESIPKEKINSETRLLASQAVKALEDNNLELASNLINRALKLDITNSQLQFLNGLSVVI